MQPGFFISFEILTVCQLHVLAINYQNYVLCVYKPIRISTKITLRNGTNIIKPVMVFMTLSIFA